jgi:hypothetical protein
VSARLSSQETVAAGSASAALLTEGHNDLGPDQKILDLRRALAADIGGGEEHRFDQRKIILFAHALHEHGSHHAAPTHHPQLQHCLAL